MSKLKYSLFELNGNVLFTIYEQDERFRAKRGEDICFEASNGIDIHSCNYPQISLNNDADVFLRGSAKLDDKSVFILHKSIFEDVCITPQELIEKIDFALKEWAEKWEGWEEELPCKDDIVGVRIKEV